MTYDVTIKTAGVTLWPANNNRVFDVTTGQVREAKPDDERHLVLSVGPAVQEVWDEVKAQQDTNKPGLFHLELGWPDKGDDGSSS